ncbi:MAG: uroporphyrinogen-III C-methyltransferase [Actinobacteria bacterium]|nr:uroporphyrinogen-III C-methyltransferase [Actinomycetota bacterium]
MTALDISPSLIDRSSLAQSPVGSICFVGAGPGHPDLLTIAGLRALQGAQIVLYDALIDFEGFRALAPLATWISVGKRANKPSPVQNFINQTIVSYVRRGFSVVRLKGGDPSIFGRLTEELDALHSVGVKATIVPGVTAASAAASTLGISLTRRGASRSVTFLTPAIGQGFDQDDHWLEAALAGDTIVMYMAWNDRHTLARRLVHAGKSPHTPVGLVESASLGGAVKRCTLEQLRLDQRELGAGPVCIIIGEVVGNVSRPAFAEVPQGVDQCIFREAASG